MKTHESAKHHLALLLAAWLSAAAAQEDSTIFLPAPSDVVEVLPRSVSYPPGELQQRSRPNDLQAALDTVSRYVGAARLTGDPAFIGRAEALLSPWIRQSQQTPTKVLCWRGILRQMNHDFAGATSILTTALLQNPRDRQARLARAYVYLVQANYDAARRDCAHLLSESGDVNSKVCLALIASQQGQLERSFRYLVELVPELESNSESRQWLFVVLAELARRLGRLQQAAAYFETAIDTGEPEVNVLAGYADVLLAQGQPHAVLSLLSGRDAVDSLLLRIAIAQARLRLPSAAVSAAELRSRFATTRRRGDITHLREEARFQLEVAGDNVAALELAKQNWLQQKEPDDLLLLQQTALAAGDNATIASVEQWRRSTGLEDSRLTTNQNGGF